MTPRLSGMTVGVAMAASHHNRERAFRAVTELRDEGAEIICILSENALRTPTKHGHGEDWLRQARELTGREPLLSVPEVEPFGPGRMLDCLIVIPCTGNMMAKLANAINDSAVTMAAKSTWRNSRPVVLAISTNDALGMNARNLGTLLAAKNTYFVPFRQDDPFHKPTSLDADFGQVVPTVAAALEGRQYQPLMLGPVLANI